jgi:hypothetical protein
VGHAAGHAITGLFGGSSGSSAAPTTSGIEIVKLHFVRKKF